jgi:T3SS negative regulator,GrlR
VNVAGRSVSPAGAELEPIADGLYTLSIDMSGAKSGHATGIVVLQDGRIMGGDSFFYYTGSYSFARGKWRGEMIVHQHAEAPGLNLVFGRREVTCGFTGTYSQGFADIDGTALVGSHSIAFRARLTLQSPTLQSPM